MNTRSQQHSDSAAQVLALIVAAKGRVEAPELERLEELRAYRRLGVSRQRFIGLARGSIETAAPDKSPGASRAAPERVNLDRVLDSVTDPRERLLVCRLAAAAITADGRVTPHERSVYERTLVHWHISQQAVSRAIQQDRFK
jgi:hypothetical protein